MGQHRRGVWARRWLWMGVIGAGAWSIDADPARTGSIPLVLSSRTQAPYAVAAGVPFPRGSLMSLAQLRLDDSVALSASGPDGDGLLYRTSGLPPGVMFDATARTLSWAPWATQAGSYPGVRVEVSGG